MFEAATKYLKEQYPKEHRHVMRLWKLTWKASRTISVIALVILSFSALAIGFLVGKQTTTTNVYMPPVPGAAASADPKPTPKAIPPSDKVDIGGVLVGTRYYSQDNKNQISGRLDRISEEISKVDQEMLLPARRALNQRFLARPIAEAGVYLETLDGLKAAAKRMDALLYDDLLAKERDYRVEMNAILLPKEPFTNFMLAADEYRNAISAWMKLSNGITDSEANQEFQQLFMTSVRSFSTARDEFVKWLSQRQELADQARRELRQ
jgi:hypothetical protein